MENEGQAGNQGVSEVEPAGDIKSDVPVSSLPVFSGPPSVSPNINPTSYDIPEYDYESMTPEMAANKLDSIYNAAARDPNHPYTKSGFGHKKFVEIVQKLTEIKVRNDRPYLERIYEEVQEEQQAKDVRQQVLLRAEADREIEALKKLNFDTDVPADIRPYHIEVWRMQRLAAEGKLKELGSLLKENNTPRWLSEFLDEPGMSDAEKIELIEVRLPHIFEYKKAAYEAKRIPTLTR